MFLVKMNFAVISTLLVLKQTNSQLVGSRGVIILPDGIVYRDEETLSASRVAADFARQFQSSGAIQSEQLRFRNNVVIEPQQTNFLTGVPNDADAAGAELSDTEVFDFVDSRYLQPLAETRFNKGLEELEAEKIINGGSTASRGEGFRMPIMNVNGIPSSAFTTRTQFTSSITPGVARFTTPSPLLNFGPLSRPRPGLGFPATSL